MIFIGKPIQILDRQEQVLHSNSIPLIDVLWQHHSTEEVTWVRDYEIHEKYLHPFDS